MEAQAAQGDLNKLSYKSTVHDSQVVVQDQQGRTGGEWEPEDGTGASWGDLRDPGGEDGMLRASADGPAPAAARATESPPLSCCPSDFSEFERLKAVERDVFKPQGREVVPGYLVADQPPVASRPCREWLRKQKPQGERPPAEAFAKIAN